MAWSDESLNPLHYDSREMGVRGMRTTLKRHFAFKIKNRDEVLNILPFKMISFLAVVTHQVELEGELGNLLYNAKVKLKGTSLELGEPYYLVKKKDLNRGYSVHLDLKSFAKHVNLTPEYYLCHPGIYFSDFYDSDVFNTYLMITFKREVENTITNYDRVIALDINSNFLVVLEHKKRWQAYEVRVPNVVMKWGYLENLIYNYDSALIVTEKLKGDVARYCFLFYYDLAFLLGERVILVDNQDNTLIHYKCRKRMQRVSSDLAMCTNCMKVVNVHINACCNMVKRAQEFLGADHLENLTSLIIFKGTS